MVIFLLIPIQHAVDNKINDLKRKSIQLIENKINRKITYSSISPSIFLSLELRGVTVLDKDGTTELINIGRIRIRYNILEVINGNFLTSLKEVSLIRSKLSIDFDRDKDIIALYTEYNKNSKIKGGSFPHVTLSGKNIMLDIKKGGSKLSFSKVYFKIKNTGTNLSYQVKGKVSGKTDYFLNSPVPLQNLDTTFKTSGSISKDLFNINSRIAFKSFKTDTFHFRSLAFQLDKKESAIFIRKVEDSAPLDLEIEYNLLNKEADISVISEDFSPSDYFSYNWKKKITAEAVSYQYTANVHINYSFLKGTLLYDGTVNAAGNNRQYLGNFTIFTKLEGDKNGIYFNSLKISSDKGRISYKGNVDFKRFFPEGTLSFKNFSFGKYTFTGNIILTGKNENISFVSRAITINGISLLDISGNVKYFLNEFDYKISFSVNTFDDNDTGTNNISLEGSAEIDKTPLVQMAITTQNVPLIPLFSLFTNNSIISKTVYEYSKSLYFSTEIFVSTNLTNISFSIRNMSLFDKKRSGNELHFRAVGNENSVNISNLEILWEGEKLTGNMTVRKTGTNISAVIDTIFNTYPYKLKLSYTKSGFFIQGNYNLSLSFFTSNRGSSFFIHADTLPIPLNSNVSEISMDSTGYYRSISDWKIELGRIKLKNLPFPITDNTAELSGEITQDKINITSIKYSDILSSITGESNFDFNLKKRDFSGTIILSSMDNKETYNSAFSYNDGILDGYAVFTDAPVQRFRNSKLSGLLSGRVNISGPVKMPDLTMNLNLEKGLLDSAPLRAAISLNLKGKKILFESFSGSFKTYNLSSGRGDINLNDGKFSISALFNAVIGGNDISSDTNFTGRFDLNDSKEIISVISLLGSKFSGVFYSKNAYVNKNKAKDWNLSINRDEKKVFSFHGGPGNSITGIIKPGGTFNFDLVKGFPLRGKISGIVSKGTINASFNNAEIDLKTINIIKINGFKFTGGVARGAVNISGDVRDPQFSGNLVVKDATVDLKYILDEIKPFDTSISFDKKYMKVAPVYVYTGSSMTQVSADFEFTGWVPVIYNVYSTTLNDTSLHVLLNIQNLGFSANGFAKGTFAVKGDSDKLLLKGDLLVHDCLITLESRDKNTTTGDKFPLFVDIKLKTGQKVEFQWPLSTLPILKVFADINQPLQINVDGFKDTYSVSGKINLKYGEVYYFQRNFYMTKGSITFDENENSFDPVLDFTAQIREVDSKGEVVNVYMILDKKPLSQFSPRFESNPSLPRNEIMAMLGANAFAILGGEKIDLSSALKLTGDLVSQFGIVKGFENKVKDIFKLDLFSIRTQVIQNIITDKFITTTGDNYSSDLFGKYLDNTTLYLGKYFGNTLFLQTMVQIGRNNFLAGDYLASDTLQVDTKISLEWKSPLFLLDFSIEPDFLDPVSSINNTSLSLSWGYSY